MQDIPIFIINLKKDIAKKQHMQALCKQHKLSCQFIEAVYGKELNETELSKVYDKEESIRELTRGEIGCALSHINIYKQMVEQNIEKAIIFEDDIQIEDDFHSIIQLSDTFPNDWELVLLGYCQKCSKDYPVKSSFKNRITITTKHKLVRLISLGKGTYGYMINIKGAKKILRESSLIKKPIDCYTGSDTHVNVYAVSPRIVRIHTVLSKQSNLEEERQQIANHYHPSHYNKRKLTHKIQRELRRPVKMLTNYLITFTKQLKQPKKYH